MCVCAVWQPRTGINRVWGRDDAQRYFCDHVDMWCSDGGSGWGRRMRVCLLLGRRGAWSRRCPRVCLWPIFRGAGRHSIARNMRWRMRNNQDVLQQLWGDGAGRRRGLGIRLGAHPVTGRTPRLGILQQLWCGMHRGGLGLFALRSGYSAAKSKNALFLSAFRSAVQPEVWRSK